MANITGSIPNLFNGVSQQTPALRLPTQGSEQTNMYPSLIQGLVKRPPLEIINDSIKGEHLHKTGTTHLVDRGGDNGDRERCFIYVTSKGITAFRPDGTQKPVNHSQDALKYLATGSNSSFAVSTIADYTFIANPRVKTRLGSKKSPVGNNAIMVKVKQSAYDADYEINVNVKKGSSKYNIKSKYHTQSSQGDTNNKPIDLHLSQIIESLTWFLNYVPCNVSEDSVTFADPLPEGCAVNPDYVYTKADAVQRGFDINKDGRFTHELDDNKWYAKNNIITAHYDSSVIYINPVSGFEIENVTVSDSEGNQLMNLIIDKASRFSDLPETAQEGTIIRITGDDTTRFNDYYLKYSDGAWHECPAPNVIVNIDKNTMPHVLIDNGNSFEFKAYDKWADRVCGDDDTSPIPDFIGSPITGIFQYRNRLGLMSEDIVALSEASEYFNFWNTTAMTQVDSDPIFLSASVEGAPTLRWAVPFNEEVILFSDRAQFKLVAPETLSPATAAVNTITNYSMNNDIKPVSNGRNIFFTDTQSNTSLENSTRVYEYFIDSDTGTKSAMEVTSHVPQYIPSSVTNMACSSGLNLLAIYAQGKNKMWLYKYYWSGNEKLQAAWFEFNFGSQHSRDIIGAEFIGDVLYLLIHSVGVYRLCKLDFSITLEGTVDGDNTSRIQPFTVYLDMLNDYEPDVTYYDYENLSYLSIPDYYDKSCVKLFDIENYRELDIHGWESDGEKRLIIYGKLPNNIKLRIGETYKSSYTFSHVFVRGSSGQQSQNQLTSHMGRLQLQHWRIVVGSTGFLEAQVVHDHGSVYSYRSTHISTSSPMNLLGRCNPREVALFDFPVRGEASATTIKLINDTYFPSMVISAEWDANYITKGRRHL